jgi:hypothetical protein
MSLLLADHGNYFSPYSSLGLPKTSLWGFLAINTLNFWHTNEIRMLKCSPELFYPFLEENFANTVSEVLANSSLLNSRRKDAM